MVVEREKEKLITQLEDGRLEGGGGFLRVLYLMITFCCWPPCTGCTAYDAAVPDGYIIRGRNLEWNREAEALTEVLSLGPMIIVIIYAHIQTHELGRQAGRPFSSFHQVQNATTAHLHSLIIFFFFLLLLSLVLLTCIWHHLHLVKERRRKAAEKEASCLYPTFKIMTTFFAQFSRGDWKTRCTAEGFLNKPCH